MNWHLNLKLQNWTQVYCGDVPSKTVLFGCIDNGTNEIENPRDIANKLLTAAEHLPPTQIQAAPDCGLVPLPLDIARLKLKAMVEGAKLARQEFGK